MKFCLRSDLCWAVCFIVSRTGFREFNSGMAGQEAVMREARWYFYQSKYSKSVQYTKRHTEGRGVTAR